MDLRELIINPGEGTYPLTLRPYVPPLVRSIAVAPGSKMLPSRSGGAMHEQPVFAATGLTETGPYGPSQGSEEFPGSDGIVKSAAVVAAPGGEGYWLSCSPLGVPTPPRPVQGVAYAQSSALWNLGGIATGWSRPYGANPGRQPTTKLAIGNWTPFSGGTRPLPSNPAPAQMLTPGF